MILYFSATGNCKYVASRLAKSIEQDMLSIVDCMHEGRYSFEDDTIGIVAHTYFWGLPSIVENFLHKTIFKTKYLYYVSTYGTTPGALANEAIKGRKIDAFYCVRMPLWMNGLLWIQSEGKALKYRPEYDLKVIGESDIML